MFDKELLKLIGGNRKYVVYTVLLMVLGMLANIGITASICWAVYFLIEGYEPLAYIYPVITAVVAIIVRYIASRCTGNLKDMLGRKVKKDLRERTYDKILKLGVRSTDGMSMAGLTQVSMEGIEQLDLYYSTYLPQFFFFHARADYFVLYLRGHRLAHLARAFGVCAAHSRVHCGCFKVREKDIRKVLGQVHLDG